MPFAGSPAEAIAAIQALRRLQIEAEDELILVDNAGTVPASAGVRVVRAAGERSPAHARNAGAERAQREWILFLDADCIAPADLLARFFVDPVPGDVGALAGAVVPAGVGGTESPGLAARYGAAKSFLDQDAHLSHSYMPRAVAANLLVRTEAFAAIGGFYEGVRAAEDTDLSWRIQRAGWRLEGRPQARVEHRYRPTVRALRRQWRGYAAGRAWLGRRYGGFVPEPALKRAVGRVLRRRRRRVAGVAAAPRPPGTAAPRGASRLGTADPRASGAGAADARPGPLERGQFLALDALLGVEELAGLALSNRPRRDGAVGRGGRDPVLVVLVAGRFPARDDPLADFALTLAGARVEASARPEAVSWQAARGLTVDYREDDGAAERALALTALLVRHPLRCVRDLVVRTGRGGGGGGRGPNSPGLAAIAPAVRRLQRDHGARVHPLGGSDARAVALRLGRLAGRRLES